MTIRFPLAAAAPAFLVFVFAASARAQLPVYNPPQPSIQLNPSAGPANSMATVGAFNFDNLFDSFELTFGTTQVGSCSENNIKTSVSCTYTVPNVAPGTYTVTLTGTSSLSTDSASATFTVTSNQISASVSSGAPGTPITVTGSGFPLSDTAITLTFSGITGNPSGSAAAPGCPATGGCLAVTPAFGCPLSGGTFSCTILVPALQPNADAGGGAFPKCIASDPAEASSGTYTLAATSNSGAQATAQFTVTDGMGFLFSTAVAGSSNAVLGGGYCVDINFTLTVNGQTAGTFVDVSALLGQPQSMLCAIPGDQVFCTFKVPNLTPGTYPATLTGDGLVNYSSSLTIVAGLTTELKDSSSCGSLGGFWSPGAMSCTLAPASELTLNSNLTLQIDAGITLAIPESLTFTNNGMVFNSGTISAGGIFNNGSGGTIYLYPGGTISNSGSFTNAGTIYSNFASTGGLAPGTIVNSGIFTNAAYMDAQPGTVTNTGSVTIVPTSGSCLGNPSIASTSSPLVLFGLWIGNNCTIGLTSPVETALDQALTIPPGTTIQIPLGTTLVNQGTMYVYGAILNLGSFVNEGSFSNGTYQANTGVLSIGGTFSNFGTLLNEQNGTLAVLNGGLLTNAPIANNQAQIFDIGASTISVNPGGTLTNSANTVIQIYPGSSLVDFGIVNNFGPIVNSGSITTLGATASIANVNGGAISNQGSGTTNGAGGVITGNVGAATVNLSASSCAALGSGSYWTAASSTCVVAYGQTVSIGYATILQIGAGVTLDIFGEVDVYGAVNVLGSMLNQSTGFLYIGTGDGLGYAVIGSGASVSNFGFISLPQSGAALSNAGTITNGPSGSIQNQGSVTNSAAVENFGSIENLNIVLNPGTIADKCGGSVIGPVTGNQPIAATCTPVPLEPVIVTLTASPNPSPSGVPVTLTATVAPLQASGTVTFLDGTTTLGQATLSSGSASIAPSLTAGPHTLTASYGGDASHALSVSAPVAETVTAGPLYNMPDGVAAGDLNGDGVPDLAVADFSGNTVSVLLGNGDGTFQPPVAYAVGNGPGSITVGDFNGDGAKDLGVLNFTDGTVSVLLGNGNGTFQPQNAYGAAFLNSPVFVAAADFNHDGKADLVVADNASTQVTVMLAQGNGTFPAGTRYTSGLGPMSIAIGDFNLDGNPDLAVVNYYGPNFEGTGTVSVLLGNSNGTFQAPAIYGSGTLNGPISVAIGDFNGDGQPDLAVANVSGGGIMTLAGQSGGTFQTPQSVASGSGQLATGDFNDDGMTDLVMINGAGNFASVLLGTGMLGNGNGTFQPATNYTTGADPVAVAVADFNHDGASDFVTANATGNSLTVVLGKSSSVSVTVNTFPAGESFIVDGVTYTETQVFSWSKASTHTLATTAQQSGGAGTQFQFSSWSDGGMLSHTVTAAASATTYTAAFTSQYLLTSASSPEGGGSVTPSPSAASGYYNAGTSVQLTAVASAGYAFSSWGGNLAGTATAQSITVNGPVTATANFTALPEPITLASIPIGLPVSVDGGTAQTTPFTVNLSVGPHTIAVAATQAGGGGTQYVFTGWSDAGAASHSITVVPLAATYTATFQTQYQLTTAASPSAGGTVTPASGIFYNAGSVVGVQATANAGYQFANFSGGALTGGTNPHNVTMNGPANVVANFTPLAPHLAATMGGIACSSTSACSASVTLTNTGLGPATNASLTGITATLGVTVATGVPRDFGTINPGASLTFPVTLNWPSTATRPAFTIGFSADGGYSGTSTVSAIR